MKTLVIAALLAVFAGPALAEVYNCKITTYSANGFRNPATAKSYFPEETIHIIEGNSAGMLPWKIRGQVTRKKNRIYINYPVQGKTGPKLTFVYTIIPSTRVLNVRIKGVAGYETVVGAHGKCAIVQS